MKQKTKNNLFDSSLFYLLLFFFNYLIVNAQLYTSNLENDITLNPDSLFLKFSEPKLPEEFYKKYNIFDNPNYIKKYDVNSFQFVCKFQVDTSNKVIESSLKIFPLYNDGNNLPTNHKLWNMVMDSVKSASKNWIVKRLFWDLEKINDTGLLEIYRKSNNNMLPISLRPSYGYQSHLMILSIYPNVRLPVTHWTGGSYNYIYRIQVE